MITIKPIFDTGSGPRVENLYEAERITYHPYPGNIGARELRDGDVLVAALWGGMAYVMNLHGKTVARYDLPADPNWPRAVEADEPDLFERRDLADEATALLREQHARSAPITHLDV